MRRRMRAGYLADVPRLWVGATFQEPHQLLTTILGAVYIDVKDRKVIVSVKVGPVFWAVFGVVGFVAALLWGRDPAPDLAFAPGVRGGLAR